VSSSAYFRIELNAFADHAHAHAAAMKLGEIVADETPQQAHQFADFLGWSRPILRAEREDGDELDADLAGGADRPPQRLNTAAMPLYARQAARRSPAAVAIHDDGDVARRPLERRHGAMRHLGLGHRF
jgi:hypothetical protein